MTFGWSDRPGARDRLRRLASRSMRWALRARSRPLITPTLGRALVIAPHPDDEAIGCGGLLAVLAGAGLAPSVAFVTDGGASHPSHSSITPAQLAELRRAESRRSAEILGLAPGALSYLGAPDGGLSSLSPDRHSEVVGKLTSVLAAVRPELLLLPCRDDRSDEHEASFALVRQALARGKAAPRILEFPVWAWRNPLHLLRPLLAAGRVWRLDIAFVHGAKAAAVDTYASQVRPIPPDTEPVLSEDFLVEFRQPEEFFFER